MRIRLTEEDAARFAIDRDLEFNEQRLMGRELMALEAQVGWTFQDLERKLEGEYATNALGEPVWETDAKGKIVLDGGGKPMRARVLKIEPLMVITWLCVYRANPEIAWKTFDMNVTGTEFTPEEDPGKAPNSPKNTTTTKRRSARSSASNRGSSAKS